MSCVRGQGLYPRGMDAGGRSTPVGDTVDDAAELKRAQIRMAIRSIERKASKAGDLLASAEDLSKFSGTVFRNVDVDSTGYVEFGELRVCLEEICALFGLEKPSQEDVETSMKDLDKDMNGKVSSDEFEALIKQVLEGMQELHQAEKHQKSSRPLKCICVLVLLIIIMLGAARLPALHPRLPSRTPPRLSPVVSRPPSVRD